MKTQEGPPSSQKTPPTPSHVAAEKSPAEDAELSDGDRENLRLEYQMCQEMLKHYDALNWQIGGIFVASVFVLVGTSLPGLLESAVKFEVGFPLVIILSAFLLCAWVVFFLRHRAMYNVRNYRLKQLEKALGYQQFTLNAETFRDTKKLPDGGKLKYYEKIPGYFVAIAVALFAPLILLVVYFYVLFAGLLPQR